MSKPEAMPLHIESLELSSGCGEGTLACPFDPARLTVVFDRPIRNLAIERSKEDALRSILSLVDGFGLPKVTRVIFNGPATVVFWDDGEKTVVKCSECGDGRCLMARGYEREADEPALWRPFFCKIHFDPEKAVMAAMLKRLYPNFQNVLRAWVADEDEADGR